MIGRSVRRRRGRYTEPWGHRRGRPNRAIL